MPDPTPSPEAPDLLDRLRATAETLEDAAGNIDFPAAYLDPAYAYADEARGAVVEIERLTRERDAAVARAERAEAALRWYAAEGEAEEFFIVDAKGERIASFASMSSRAREALSSATPQTSPEGAQ